MKDRLLRHKSLVAIWLVVFVIGGYVLFMLFASPKSDNNPSYLSASTTRPDSAQSAAKNHHLNEAVTDGNLEFTVGAAKCGSKTVGENQYAQAEAEGQFCLLTVTVKNEGTTSVDLPLGLQKAFVADDKSYPVREDATQYAQANQAQTYWYQQIAPGKTVTGDLIFDVNGNEKLIGAQLQSNSNSPGIRINL